jgi:hypothetical protein
VDYCRLVARFGLTALVATTAISCAQERDTINRVDAYALDKTFFVGPNLADPSDDPEFYAATTVVDVPYGVQAGVFTGMVGDLRRIKWEITDELLNARLTYELINGADGKGNAHTNTGQIVASFKILSHFDIKREYNPQTGEELNIIGENTTDRPWYERSYFRVDWSQNVVESSYNFDPLAMLKLDGQQLESLSYRVDPNDPDAPQFVSDQGYFDITNKVYLKSADIGGTPSCFYYAWAVAGGTYPFGMCDPAEVKLRLSFSRVPQATDPNYRDYEPREWDGARYNAHGAFMTDRLGYDRHYGVIDAKWHHLINRYNIWDKSHLDVPCTASVDNNNNGTDDDCESAPGSRCDDLVGACTVPYAKRVTRPNAWHFNLSNDDEVIFDSTNRAAEEWDTALREAVQAARLVECERTKGASIVGTRWEGQDCAKAFPINQTDDAEVTSVRALNACWSVSGYKSAMCAPSDPNSVAALDKMIALCHNPVSASDDPMCGGTGLVTRPGDIRYHQVNVVPTPQTSSPWGYGPTLADPLSGEVIQAGINVWNAVTDTAAQNTIDQIRWMNGELQDYQITTGDYVQNWAQAASAHMPGSAPMMTPGAIDQRVVGTGAMTADKLQATAALRKAANVDVRNLTRELMARTLDATQAGTITGQSKAGGTAYAEAQARIQMAKGTPEEAALMAPAWLDMAGVDCTNAQCGADKQVQLTDAVLNRASPIRGLDGNTVAGIEQQAQAGLAQKGQCVLAAPEPTGLVPLAKIMKDKFPYDANASAADQTARVNKMWNYLRGKFNYAVIAHEMGHTIGMRHNFASSWDKFNYRPQYWQLRTRGGTSTNPCTGPVADGSTCLGPRYYDPLDQDEIDQMIWMWQQTTVMDYAGDVTQDTLGLGVYDYSAARAFYADVVDVRAQGATVPGVGAVSARTQAQKVGSEMFDMVDSAIQPFAGTFVDDESDPNGDGSPNYIHYTQWNNFFGLLNKASCRPADTSPPQGWDADANGTYSPVFDGHIVRGEVCDRMPVDYVDWRDMVPDQTSVVLTNYSPFFVLARRAKDVNNRPRMPYAFCPDDWVEGGIPSCYQHDNGADIFEEMMFHDRLYEDRHIFDNFRRGRSTFSIYGAYQRSVSRYHTKMETLASEYAFIHDFILHDVAYSNSVPYSLVTSIYEAEGAPLRDFLLASSFAFDHFTRALVRPQPGPHTFNQKDFSILRPYDGALPGQGAIDVPQGSMGMGNDVSYGGRETENGFISTNGYYLANSAGSYYDKTWAIASIVAQGVSSGNWSRAQSVDGRWLSSNLTNLYPDGARRLIGAVLTEDQATYGARVATSKSGLPSFQQVGMYKYPLSPIGWVSFTQPDGPAICWPSNGAEACTDVKGTPLPGAPATAPTTSLPVDPELGFEVQKFVLFYSYVYLPANEKNDWLDMLRVFRLGGDVNPTFDASSLVEWVDPQTGFHYIAKRFGNEQMMGTAYDKGIGAKMIQWANTLAARAYAPADPAQPFDAQTGRFNYKMDASGQPVVLADPNFPPDDPNNVRCDENTACVQLRNYRGVIDYSRDLGKRFGVAYPCLNGIFQPGTYCD